MDEGAHGKTWDMQWKVVRRFALSLGYVRGLTSTCDGGAGDGALEGAVLR